MNTERLPFVIGLALFCSIMILLANREATHAQECRIVWIHGAIHTTRVEPEVLWISKDGCVVWYNRAPKTEVKILFEDGKKCQEITKAPSGFELDAAKDCYVTRLIPFGGTASLMFIEKGTYKYIVESTGGEKTRGELVVR